MNSLKMPENNRNICRRCSTVAAPHVADVAAVAADVAANDDAPSHAAAAVAAVDADAGVCVCVCVCVYVRVCTR